MFGRSNVKVVTLDDIADEWSKGQNFKKDQIIENGVNECIHYGELFTKYSVYIDNILSKTNAEGLKISKYGDIIFPASDVTPEGLTKCSAVLKDGVIYGGDIIILRPKTKINPLYLSFAIRIEKDQLIKRVTGSIVRHISAKSLKTVIIKLPTTELQDKFAEFYKHLDKSKFAIKEAMNNAQKIFDGILRESLC